MKDRTPKYPGRVQLTPVTGKENTFDLVRADEPVEEGTPLNKKTLLTDETAYLLELKMEDPTPDDAFSHIARNFTGDAGMGINLLEEAVNMKYCKVITRANLWSEVEAFYANSIVQTGYESDDGNVQVLACIEKSGTSQLRVRVINKKLNKVFDSVIPLYIDVYKSGLTGASTQGGGLYANFNGWFHVTPVKNKTNEVMLKICGDLHRASYYSSTYYYRCALMRLVHVIDVTTGQTKAHVYAVMEDTAATYRMDQKFCFGMGNNDYCYYNATYGFYYTPLLYHAGNAGGKTGRIFYVKRGYSLDKTNSYQNILVSGKCGFISTLTASTYVGSSYYYSSSYTGRGFSWYVPITDTEGVAFTYDSYMSQMYVYAVSQTDYSTFSKTTVYSSGSFYAFTRDSWSLSPVSEQGLKIHILQTDNNELYMFAPGTRHSSHTGYSSSSYYCLMRFGPFSLSTTNENPPVAKVVAGLNQSISTAYASHKVFHMIGCMGGDPEKPVYSIIPVGNTLGGYGGTVVSLAKDLDGKSYRLMMPSVMGGLSSTSSASVAYRYNGVNNPWAKGQTLPTCWYNAKLTKMFMCQMDRSVYLGDFVGHVDEDSVGTWVCPEDGNYKIIMVGGGAAGGAGYGGGSGYLNITTRTCVKGEEIPFHVGLGETYDYGSSIFTPETSNPVTWFGDPSVCANGGFGSRGGANGYPASGGGGGGGYDLVEYGGNGQLSNAVPLKNGGQGTLPAIGYGAGGSSNNDGEDGVIVIVR